MKHIIYNTMIYHTHIMRRYDTYISTAKNGPASSNASACCPARELKAQSCRVTVARHTRPRISAGDQLTFVAFLASGNLIYPAAYENHSKTI